MSTVAEQLTLTGDQVSKARREIIEAMARYIISGNIESAGYEKEEGNDVDIKTYGTDRDTVLMFCDDFADEIADVVATIQKAL